MNKEEKLEYLQKQITTIQQALLRGDPTITSHTVDGDTTTYDRKWARTELTRLEEELNTLLGLGNGLVHTINIPGMQQ